jgi:hypothetical protein
MTEDNTHDAQDKTRAMVVIGRRRVAMTTTSAKISTTSLQKIFREGLT